MLRLALAPACFPPVLTRSVSVSNAVSGVKVVSATRAAKPARAGLVVVSSAVEGENSSRRAMLSGLFSGALLLPPERAQCTAAVGGASAGLLRAVCSSCGESYLARRAAGAG